jgi:type VI secretion system protein ImpG
LFNTYYEDELTYLRQLGREFAEANPAAAPYLAERGADPDVERLLEGFAFLAGRLRQKLDDQLPELTQSLMQLLWPHYLRPIPAMSIVEFQPKPQVLREPQNVPRGAELESNPVDGTACRFRTAFDVELYPIEVRDARMEIPPGTKGHIAIRVGLTGGSKLEALDLRRLRFFLHGEPSLRNTLFLQLTRRVERIVARPGGSRTDTGTGLTLPSDAVGHVGFEQEEALLPYPPHAFPGYRLLQEYFNLPEKYLFLEVGGLERLAGLRVDDEFELIFEFSEEPEKVSRLAAENFRLFCTPVVNLYETESDPIRVGHEKTEYLVRPSGGDPLHQEIFSVDRVSGWESGTADEREYPPFFSFRHGLTRSADSDETFYATQFRPSVVDHGQDTFMSFVSPRGAEGSLPTETVIVKLTCANRDLPTRLGVGDISRPTAESPQVATFRNITRVTAPVRPPLEGRTSWQLISNLSLNYLSLSNAEALRKMLEVYNFQALYDRQAARENELRLAGIEDVHMVPEERFYRGAPIRGSCITIEMNEENFAGEGEMVLFASVLNRFLSLYCTLNSYVRLVVKGKQHGDIYEWKAQAGQQTLI